MARVPWPLGLPPLVDLKSYTRPDTRLSSATEQGPGKMRNRFTAQVKRATYGYVVDGAGLEAFEFFFYTTLVGGTGEFEFVDPKTDSACGATFAKDWVPEWSLFKGGPPAERLWSTNPVVEILPGA